MWQPLRKLLATLMAAADQEPLIGDQAASQRHCFGSGTQWSLHFV